MSEEIYPSSHRCEVLLEDFTEGFGTTQNNLVVSIGFPRRLINGMVHSKWAITALRAT